MLTYEKTLEDGLKAVNRARNYDVALEKRIILDNFRNARESINMYRADAFLHQEDVNEKALRKTETMNLLLHNIICHIPKKERNDGVIGRLQARWHGYNIDRNLEKLKKETEDISGLLSDGYIGSRQDEAILLNLAHDYNKKDQTVAKLCEKYKMTGKRFYETLKNLKDEGIEIDSRNKKTALSYEDMLCLRDRMLIYGWDDKKTAEVADKSVYTIKKMKKFLENRVLLKNHLDSKDMKKNAALHDINILTYKFGMNKKQFKNVVEEHYSEKKESIEKRVEELMSVPLEESAAQERSALPLPADAPAKKHASLPILVVYNGLEKKGIPRRAA